VSDESVGPAKGGRRTKLEDFKRAEILAAARRLLGPTSQAGFSLRAIAKEAGYSPAALYSYFPNIDGLMAALAGEGLGALARALKAAVDPGAAPEARLARLIDAACEAAEKVPLEAPLLATLLDPARRNADRVLARQFNGRLIAALTALGAAIPDDGLSREARAEAGVALAAAVLGLLLFERSGILSDLGLRRQALVEALAARFAKA
jgi:AcrR family transcriptional regulator